MVAITLLSNHRLGNRDPAPGLPPQVEQLELQLGQETVACSAQVVGKSSLLPSLLWEEGEGGEQILALSTPDKASPKVL